MREVELKSVVPDLAVARRRVEEAGGVLTFAGSLFDLRYGDAAGSLARDDHVVRLRVYERDGEREGFLDWKGPTRYENGYKVREEVSTRIDDPAAMARILENLGLRVIRDIERRVAQYTLKGAVVRFEEYPRMDTLVEIEGPPEAIEMAIELTGIPRSGFTPERLPDFTARFEARTGQKAALSARELAGEYSYSAGDA
ncbi:MAG: class IV adenylate cyclase [Gemmatimonadaceae bacterium]